MKYFAVHSNPSFGRWLWFFTFCIAGLLVLFWKDGPAKSRVNSAADTSLVSSSSAHKPTESLTRGKFREIQDFRVGDRVLAENPEVGAAERAAYVEPDWRRWLQISLQMPKADGSVLEMELLRPDEWLIEQATLLVDEPGIEYVRADLLAESDAEVEEVGGGCGPIRPAFADLGWRLELAEACGLVASGFVVQMDLPELGLTGEAVVVEVQPAPVVKAGAGRVVTATFKHSSGDVIDLVVAGDGSQETLGTTSNHPFWSVDRQDYVQAGKLELGERLQTYSGDTKRVVSKLARPGPEPVFNLEVHAEHVYYVGQQGLLVHNSDQYAPNSTVGRMNPRDIRFTQDTVSPNFSDGGTLTDVVNQLRRGQLSADDFPTIRVVEHNGKLYSLDNRRLSAFKAAQLDDIPIQRLDLSDPAVKAEFLKKFRPINDGLNNVVVPSKGRAEARRILREFGKYDSN